VVAADSLARADAPTGMVTGPVIVDLESVQRVGRRVARDTSLTIEQIRVSIPVVADAGGWDSAIRCERPGYPCRTLRDAVFIQLSSVAFDSGQLFARAHVYVTHRNYAGHMTLCFLDVQVAFTERVGRWERGVVSLETVC